MCDADSFGLFTGTFDIVRSTKLDILKNRSHDIVIVTTSVLTFRSFKSLPDKAKLCHLVGKTKSYLFNAINSPFSSSLVPLFQNDS